ncbi:MAG: hypothetical protein WC785_07330 [Tatlockia sp.]|jgi:hypothetical protein
MKYKMLAIGLSSIFAVGVAQATTHCNGYEIRIKNNLSDNLIVDKMDFTGADLQPSKVFKIDRTSEIVFIVNNTSKKMNADFAFHTFSLPRKEVSIRFDLTNVLLRCDYDDRGIESNVAVDASHSGSKATYTIG